MDFDPFKKYIGIQGQGKKHLLAVYQKSCICIYNIGGALMLVS